MTEDKLQHARVALEEAGYVVIPPGEPTERVSVLGSVSASSGKPFIRIDVGGYSGQFTPDQARAHAALVIEAAQNAVTDAALFAWGKEELDFDDHRAAVMIDALRRYRQDKWGS